MLRLDSNKIPEAVIPLFPMAEKWGIGDDFERDEAVRRASRDDLEQFVNYIEQVDDKSLYGWLGGPEFFNSKPTPNILLSLALQWQLIQQS